MPTEPRQAERVGDLGVGQSAVPQDEDRARPLPHPVEDRLTSAASSCATAARAGSWRSSRPGSSARSSNAVRCTRACLAAVRAEDVQPDVGGDAGQPAPQPLVVGRRRILAVEPQEDLLRGVLGGFVGAE
ncbi:MAG: hypothetical protein U0232_09435 [Thermomicrobiales bacterium]